MNCVLRRIARKTDFGTLYLLPCLWMTAANEFTLFCCGHSRQGGERYSNTKSKSCKRNAIFPIRTEITSLRFFSDFFQIFLFVLNVPRSVAPFLFFVCSPWFASRRLVNYGDFFFLLLCISWVEITMVLRNCNTRLFLLLYLIKSSGTAVFIVRSCFAGKTMTCSVGGS